MSEQIENFLLKDLVDYRSQNSWDWDADRRLAEFLGEKEAVKNIRDACESNSVTAIRIAFWKIGGGERIKKLRLRTLARLVKIGKVRAEWKGLGYGGFNEFGLRRVRVFFVASPNQTN